MAQRTVIGCVSVLIGLPLSLCCIFAILLVVNETAGTGSETLVLLGAVAFGVFVMVLPIGVLAFIALRRARRLDAIFTPLGELQGKPYAIQWRQYDGQIGGRSARLRFWRGPKVSLSLAGNVGTRMAIGTRTALGQAAASAFASSQIVLDGSDIAHLAASGRDSEWARALLADQTARSAILRLTQDTSATEMRSLIFEPEAMRLMISYVPMSFVTTDSLRPLLDDMQTVLSAAERLPPPAERP
jgi:hypothetical protein